MRESDRIGRMCTRLVVLAGALGGAPLAVADFVSVSLDKALYGHVSNLGDRCASTATANSFIYLQNAYPAIFNGDSRIVRDNAGAVTNDGAKLRDALCDGWGNLTGPRAGMSAGTTLKKWWETKVTWLDDWAPGKTDVSGMMFGENTATWIKGNKITSAYPTWDYMWNSISTGCDVELNVINLGFTSAHALTLTGLRFDDTDNDGTWDAGEARSMSFIDPNDANDANAANIQPLTLTVGAGGRFEFKWWQDGGQWYVDSALSERAVPAPSVIALLGAMGIGVVGGVRRRRPA